MSTTTTSLPDRRDTLKHGARARRRGSWSSCVQKNSVIRTSVSNDFLEQVHDSVWILILLTIPLAGVEKEELSHSTVKDLFAKTFSDFHDLKLKTRSIHGDKHFTAWEWVMTCKITVGSDGKRLKKEEALPKKLVGCTLMWWNKNDKIVKNHEYIQMKDE